jgi:hypothetical protein
MQATTHRKARAPLQKSESRYGLANRWLLRAEFSPAIELAIGPTSDINEARLRGLEKLTTELDLPL